MAESILYTAFDNVEEDWTGLSDKKKRKQLQNRINQRARRRFVSGLPRKWVFRGLRVVTDLLGRAGTRKLRAQLAANVSGRDEDTTILVRQTKQAPSPSAWSSNPTFPIYPGASLSSLEWEILFFGMKQISKLCPALATFV